MTDALVFVFLLIFAVLGLIGLVSLCLLGVMILVSRVTRGPEEWKKEWIADDPYDDATPEEIAAYAQYREETGRKRFDTIQGGRP